MNEPYLTVFINGIIFLVTILGVYIYTYVYPKKQINYFILLIIVSLFPCFSIFRNGVYESGDFLLHIYNAMAFSDALKDGILIPSWGADLNGGFGYPIYLFIYNIPYYLISFLNLAGFTFIFSTKILLALGFIGSGLMMYAALKKLTNNVFASFAGAVVYLYTPYHLVDMHFRVAIAEFLAFVITPAIFYFILKLQEKHKLIYILWLGLLFGILFLDHPAQFIFYSGIFFAYLIYNIFFLKKYEIKLLLLTFLSFCIGLAICSYAWLSRFTLSQFTHSSHLMNAPLSYVQPWELLYSPWRFGLLFQGHFGEQSYLIGYTQIILLFFILYLLIKKKFNPRQHVQVIFWFSLTIILIFSMLPYSKPLWDLFPFLSLMQFAYRFLHPLIFCLAVLTAYTVIRYKNKKNIVNLLLLVTVAYTILNWGNRGMITTIDDNKIRQNIYNSTREGEGLIEGNPLWFNPKGSSWIDENVEKRLEFIKGQGEIKELTRTTTRHTYVINANKPSTLLENTFYFPNWTIKANGKPVKINYQTEQYPGRMVFEVPKGPHYITVQYSDILAITYAKMLSLLTLFSIMLYFIFYYLQLFKRK